MKEYLPYGDSPTIRSYTRWEVFEEAAKREGSAKVSGVEESREDLLPPHLWFDNLHNQKVSTFRITDNKVSIEGKDGMSFLHLKGRVEGTLLIEEKGNVSVTGELKGRGTVLHVVEGGPHYSRWNIEGDINIRTLVKGEDIYLRYETRGNIDARGVSLEGRSDINHELHVENGEVFTSHLLIGREGDFLVYRPVAKVYRGGKSHLEALLLKRGGFVVGVPSVEVYTSDVRAASHSVKDLVLSEEQLFYLRSRGFSPEEAERYLMDSLLQFLLGDLKDRVHLSARSISE